MFVTFFTRQHLAWLGVSCQHLLICTSGDFNQWWVGNCERVRVWSSVWHTAVALMDNDRDVSISSPVGNEKRGLAVLWSAGRSYRTCHCMPLIHFPRSHTQIPANHPFSACVQGRHERWASVIQPPSQLCFHFAGLQVSAVGLHSHRHQEVERYLACSLLCRKKQPTTHCFPQ